MYTQCMAMQKTLAGSRPMVQWYRRKPIMGVLSGQLLKTRVVSLVIRQLLMVLLFGATQ